jgi:putative tryptophan/tyrosine transport system substrate-binding protein
VGYYAARMLRGAKPADMPIEQPSRYERVLNMKSARTLGLNTPQSIQVQVDRTIS